MYNLINTVVAPTRITNNTKSLLDVIIRGLTQKKNETSPIALEPRVGG
jgi:hypothetical protein